ncbi:MAG: T9SS type A sorting domain-containing protein [Ignavibacteriae bacterium]|nr:T9SS type A sorting domain-containing protein [Ignavibacteriota bacterium]
MKNLLFLGLFFIMTLRPAKAQEVCGSVNSEGGTLPSTTTVLKGGKEITNQGVLKVLVIFVRFADDTQNTSTWPDYTVLPSWATTFVDAQVPDDGIYTAKNLSDFFNRASGGLGTGLPLGKLKLIGNVYYVTTDNPRSSYTSDGQVNQHVWAKLDPVINYNLYDNWRFMKDNQQYNHEYLSGSGDGIVDYIFMIWRGASISLGSNVGGYKPLPGSYTSNDGDAISSRSGSMQFNYRNKGAFDVTARTIYDPAHEFMHYIFGGSGNVDSHIDGRVLLGIQNIGNVEWFSLMTRGAYGNMSAYERYRAGWLTPTVVEATTTLDLLDTHIKNKAVLIPIRKDSYGNFLEYFIIENYQTIYSYSTANPFLRYQIFNHSISRGALAYHVEDEHFSLPTSSKLDIEAADGLWNWDLSQGASTPSDRSDDIIFRATPAPSSSSSYDERDLIYINVSGTVNEYLALTPESDPSGQDLRRRYTRDATLGDNEDFFRETEVNICSNWSNPNTNKLDGNASNTAFQMLTYNSSTKAYSLKVAVGYNDVVSLPPSVPQNLVFTNANTHNQYPYLTWNANTEPDLAGYDVWREYKEPGYTQTDKVGSLVTGTSFTDYGIRTSSSSNNTITYWIKAVDNSALVSNSSNKVSSKSMFLPKRVDDEVLSIKPANFEITQNRPNPFNPSTIIEFALPEVSNVSLKVYDVLGREVQVLADGEISPGFHAVELNAVDWPSGAYFYRIVATGKSGNQFTKVMKMALAK